MLDLLPVLVLLVALLLVVAYWVPHWRMHWRVGATIPDRCYLLSSGTQHAALYFFSLHCGRCQAITPLMDELEQRGEKVIRIDVTHQPEPARRFQVRVVPAVLIVDHGRISRVLVGPGMAGQIRKLVAQRRTQGDHKFTGVNG